jgi:hypothetical protein
MYGMLLRIVPGIVESEPAGGTRPHRWVVKDSLDGDLTIDKEASSQYEVLSDKPIPCAGRKLLRLYPP